MKAKLTEALQIAYELTADIEGRYPISLIRIRFLLEQVLGDLRNAEPLPFKPVPRSDDWNDEVIELTEESPQPTA